MNMNSEFDSNGLHVQYHPEKPLEQSRSELFALRAQVKALRDALGYYAGAPWVENRTGVWSNSDYAKVAKATLASIPDDGMLSRLVQAIDDEPELPGLMPEQLHRHVHNYDRQQMTEYLQNIVKVTKDNIRARLLSSLSTPKGEQG